MRIRDEQLFDPVIIFSRCRLLTATTAFLRAIFFNRLRLEVAAVGERDDHVLRLDEIFH